MDWPVLQWLIIRWMLDLFVGESCINMTDDFRGDNFLLFFFTCRRLKYSGHCVSMYPLISQFIALPCCRFYFPFQPPDGSKKASWLRQGMFLYVSPFVALLIPSNFVEICEEKMLKNCSRKRSLGSPWKSYNAMGSILRAKCPVVHTVLSTWFRNRSRIQVSFVCIHLLVILCCCMLMVWCLVYFNLFQCCLESLFTQVLCQDAPWDGANLCLRRKPFLKTVAFIKYSTVVSPLGDVLRCNRQCAMSSWWFSVSLKLICRIAFGIWLLNLLDLLGPLSFGFHLGTGAAIQLPIGTFSASKSSERTNLNRKVQFHVTYMYFKLNWNSRHVS